MSLAFIPTNTTTLSPTDELYRAVVVIHPHHELRHLYARRLKPWFAAVEHSTDPEALEEYARVLLPEVIVIHTDALSPQAVSAIRAIKTTYPETGIVTVGDLDRAALIGSMAHVSPVDSSMTDVVDVVRRAAGYLFK